MSNGKEQVRSSTQERFSDVILDTLLTKSTSCEGRQKNDLQQHLVLVNDNQIQASLRLYIKFTFVEGYMGQNEEVAESHGRSISIHELNKSYDLWVHKGSSVDIKKTSPDSPLARQKLKSPRVYEISRHVRGKAVLISNTGYHAVRLFKSAYEQLQFKTVVYVEKPTEMIFEVIRNECRKPDNKAVNAIVCIIYAPPDDFDASKLLEVFSSENCPHLKGKPKLLYIIGNDIIVQQVDKIRTNKLGPDYFIGATGFFGLLYSSFLLHKFAHELDVASIWKLQEKFAILHNYRERSYSTLEKEFYFFPGLTMSDIPHEIEQMDPYEIELYLKMVEKSKMKTYNIRLMFVGLFGAGKTSLARRIMNCGIDGVTSTDGIDVHIGRCRVNLENKEWITTEDESHKPYAKLSRLLNENPDEEARLPNLQDLASDYTSNKRKFMEDIVPSIETIDTPNQTTMAGDKGHTIHENKKQKKEDRSEEHQSSSMDDSGNMNRDSFNQELMETENSAKANETLYQRATGASKSMAVKVLKEYKTSRRKTDPEAHVSLWDFAGQFIYYSTHHLFFSPRAIYLLVLNMTQDLDSTIKEDWFLDVHGIKDMGLKDGVHFWMKSIYTFSRSLVTGIPPIILVGTHKDRMEGIYSGAKKNADEYFREISDAFVGQKFACHLKHETFLVDNTREDPEIEKLREYIFTTATSMPYWGESIPARWIEMEQMLEEIRAEGKPFITKTELEHLDSKMSIPIRDREQLTLFLKYENAAGILIYFDEDDLRNTVVIEPRWIINAFRFLISATCFDDKYGHLKKEWHMFIKTGKLKIELAEKIWKLDEVNGFFANSSLLFQFLDKLDIMSRAKIVSEDGLNVEYLDFYFVPCLLNEQPPEALLLSPAGSDILSSSNLCFTFEDAFLPPAVFNRILSTCLGMWPAARQGDKQLLFCGCGVFEVTHDKDYGIQRLTIFLKDSKIGLRVTRYGTERRASVDSQVCDRIRRIIARALEKELSRYKLANENPESKTKPYVYAIQCPETQVGKGPLDGLIQVDVLMQRYKDKKFFSCIEHPEKVHPHPLDPAELLKDWFPDEVVTKAKGFISRYSSQRLNECVTDKELSVISRALGAGWQILGITLGLTKAEVDRREDGPLHMPIMQIYEMLLAWKQKEQHEATIGNLLKAVEEIKTMVTLDQETIKNVLDRIK